MRVHGRTGAILDAPLAMIPFNKAWVAPQAIENTIDCARNQTDLAGNGAWGQRCISRMREITGAEMAWLTPSCTAALEMATMKACEPGGSVVLPSFTFSSTATAVIRRCATPVFVDIREDTLNIDENLAAEAAENSGADTVIVVHYAGVPCETETLTGRSWSLIEDAAQAFGSTTRGRPVGTGALCCFSFHSTKNVTCGEGGAVTGPAVARDAFDVIQEKGTDRSRLIRGEIDKYTWQQEGSSFLLGELSAAFLSGQLDAIDYITSDRMGTWDAYHAAFDDLERRGYVRRPVVPEHVTHNAHMYYLLLDDELRRDHAIRVLREHGVQAFFHYVPLHSSPAGRRYGRVYGNMRVTDDVSSRLIRLPLWTGMTRLEVEQVIDSVHKAVSG